MGYVVISKAGERKGKVEYHGNRFTTLQKAKSFRKELIDTNFETRTRIIPTARVKLIKKTRGSSGIYVLNKKRIIKRQQKQRSTFGSFRF